MSYPWRPESQSVMHTPTTPAFYTKYRLHTFDNLNIGFIESTARRWSVGPIVWKMKYYSQEGKEYPTYNKKEGTLQWIGHILRSNCLLKHVIERKIVGKICDGKKRKNT